MENIDVLLNSAKGPLNNDQIASGLHFCYCNACDLLDEAKLLLQHRKLARSFALLVLSLEELAKIPLLSNAVLLRDSDAKAWKTFWKAFSSHKLKQNIWSIYGKSPLLTERRHYYENSYPKTLPSLDRVKQLSFYVDYLSDATAIKPEILFEHMKGLVGLVLKMAEDRIEAFRPLHSTLSGSRKAVALMSRIEIKGVSNKELEQMLFQSMNAIKNSAGKA